MSNPVEENESVGRDIATSEVKLVTEELIDVNKKFVNEEEEEYIKDSKRYLYDEVSYINRINTFKIWVRKPTHLCSLILARNGFICESECVIKCEMCKCKYVYEKNTYSMYTRINDLCLLHLDNCPWKNKIMDLSVFKLDDKSLSRQKILEEYENNTKLIKSSLVKIPLINIKKTINDLILIVKKHLDDDISKKKFLIFNSHVEFFKKHFIQIFLNNKSVIDEGIEKIKKNYKHLEKNIIDMNYLNNLHFDLFDVTNYINILSDDEYSTSLLIDEKEDINMYYKIVNKMKNYNYEHVNIFKIIALLGWTCKDNPYHSKKYSSHILLCRYCYREVDISNYSFLSSTDNELHLFKDYDADKAKDIMEDLENKKRHRKERRENANAHGMNVMQRIFNLISGYVDKGGESAIEDGKEEDGKEEDGKEEDGKEEDGKEEDGKEEDGKEEDGEKEDGEKEDGEKEDGEKEDGEKEDGQEEGGNKAGAVKDDDDRVDNGKEAAPRDDSTISEMENQRLTKDTESSLKWTLKHFFLPKKRSKNLKENEEDSNTSLSKNDMVANNKIEANCSEYKLYKVKLSLKDSMSKLFLEICSYMDDDKFFIKTLYDYYTLTTPPMEYINDEGNTNKEKKCYYIRPFNAIENHRIYCPYITEDLYAFSKITKLLFELLMSEFERKFEFK
ncbi:zinc finger protein [Plasmodium brasilianum]|uniref:Zinc finger protein, putative n=2 Tax=Plasmodium (Plasmodium) TaxID=418103 RepID=A0A1A8WPV5_PLAMA|nr:zinc finger protein, putative [Plasmodium malariae]KAI4837784.1 zinc finger protein [Plasmodium brasilianum]SBS94923.1 zinc finger protein, putative [Plasmodium malariae]SCN44795.1 zinc finger protein, putative [Plasmodium malariae]